MKSKVLVFFLLVVLAFTSLGAGQPQFAGSEWAPLVRTRRDARRVRRAHVQRTLTGPVPMSALDMPNEPMSVTTLKGLLPKMSTAPALSIAYRLGMYKLAGKKLDDPYRVGKAPNNMDAIVSAEGKYWENEPSVAVNPLYPSIVVVFNHYYNSTSGGPCLATVSFDGGRTFNYNDYVSPPLLSASGDCSDPVVRFSPDGQYVYYFYMDAYQVGSTYVADILMQRAEGTDPTTLVGSPVKVFDSGGTDFFDKEWGDVHPHDYAVGGGNGGVLYATATKFDSGGGCSIVFNASYDHGVTWQYSATAPHVLDTDADCNPTLTGSRPIGGNDNFMMVCWFDSGSDGYLAGGFNITCTAHDNLGSPSSGSWSPYFYPFLNKKYEVSQWLDPYDSYHRWFATMFPVLAVDEEGMVYVATTADNSNINDAEAGNIYVTWAWLDYTVSTLGSWAKPKAVGSGGGAQGFPTMAARYDGAAGMYKVFLGYYSYTKKNAYYKTLYRMGQRKPGTVKVSWKGKVTLSDRLSVTDDYFLGDYIDSAITGRHFYVAWTDRSDAYSKTDYDDDVLLDVVSIP